MAKQIKITWPLIETLIGNQFGSGFGEHYKAWIRIVRSNTSKVSTQVIQALPPYRRACHFLSQSEYAVALAVSWIGAEFREQLPLWPWEHSHPETGRNLANDRFLTSSPGMREICREAGFSHGTFLGTRIPYIWTIDLCVHLPWIENPTQSTVMISVKPEEVISAENAWQFLRSREKLEGERRYCLASNIKYLVGDHTIFPASLYGNLDSLRGSALIPNWHPASRIMQSYLDKHLHKLNTEALNFTIQVLKRDYRCHHRIACLILNHLMWHQIIDVDLGKPLIYRNPPIPGGKAIMAEMRKNLEAA